MGIVPPPPGVPFLAFNAVLNIDFGTAPNTDAFTLGTSFTLSSTAPAFNPLTDPVTLQIGTFAVTIPPGSFKKNDQGDFSLRGSDQRRDPEGGDQAHGHLALQFPGGGAECLADRDPERRLSPWLTAATIGSNSGATSVTAQIFPHRSRPQSSSKSVFPGAIRSNGAVPT